jgi:hypothetical protein
VGLTARFGARLVRAPWRPVRPPAKEKQMSADPYAGTVVGRDPLAKTMTEMMVAAHPDWTDVQVAERINREYSSPVITVAEVAYWRPEVAR